MQASPSISVSARKDKGKGKAKETSEDLEAEGTYSRVIDWSDYLTPEPVTPPPRGSPFGIGPEPVSPLPATPEGKQPPSRIPGSLPTWEVLNEKSISTLHARLLSLPENGNDKEVKVEEVEEVKVEEVKVEEVEVKPLRRSTRNTAKAIAVPVASSSRLTSVPPPKPAPTKTHKRKNTTSNTVEAEAGPSRPTISGPAIGTRFSRRLQAPPAPKAPSRVRAPTRATKAPKIEVDEYELPQLAPPPVRRGVKRGRADEDEAGVERKPEASGSRPTKRTRTTKAKAPAKTRSKSKK